jgi:hypothetical protein
VGSIRCYRLCGGPRLLACFPRGGRSRGSSSPPQRRHGLARRASPRHPHKPDRSSRSPANHAALPTSSPPRTAHAPARGRTPAFRRHSNSQTSGATAYRPWPSDGNLSAAYPYAVRDDGWTVPGVDSKERHVRDRKYRESGSGSNEGLDTATGTAAAVITRAVSASSSPRWPRCWSRAPWARRAAMPLTAASGAGTRPRTYACG